MGGPTERLRSFPIRGDGAGGHDCGGHGNGDWARSAVVYRLSAKENDMNIVETVHLTTMLALVVSLFSLASVSVLWHTAPEMNSN